MVPTISALRERADEVVRRVLAGPGIAVQRLTTAEPSDDQIEVAVAAMAGLVEGAPVRQ